MGKPDNGKDKNGPKKAKAQSNKPSKADRSQAAAAKFGKSPASDYATFNDR